MYSVSVTPCSILRGILTGPIAQDFRCEIETPCDCRASCAEGQYRQSRSRGVKARSTYLTRVSRLNGLMRYSCTLSDTA